MATTDLQPESARTKISQSLYNAYRRAKAEWDLALYSDDHEDGSDDPQASAHTEALRSYLMGPAGDICDLARKLRVFRDEEAHEYDWGGAALTAIAADAHRLAWPSDHCWALALAA